MALNPRIEAVPARENGTQAHIQHFLQSIAPYEGQFTAPDQPVNSPVIQGHSSVGHARLQSGIGAQGGTLYAEGDDGKDMDSESARRRHQRKIRRRNKAEIVKPKPRQHPDLSTSHNGFERGKHHLERSAWDHSGEDEEDHHAMRNGGWTRRLQEKGQLRRPDSDEDMGGDDGGRAGGYKRPEVRDHPQILASPSRRLTIPLDKVLGRRLGIKYSKPIPSTGASRTAAFESDSGDALEENAWRRKPRKDTSSLRYFSSHYTNRHPQSQSRARITTDRDSSDLRDWATRRNLPSPGITGSASWPTLKSGEPHSSQPHGPVERFSRYFEPPMERPSSANPTQSPAIGHIADRTHTATPSSVALGFRYAHVGRQQRNEHIEVASEDSLRPAHHLFEPQETSSDIFFSGRGAMQVAQVPSAKSQPFPHRHSHRSRGMRGVITNGDQGRPSNLKDRTPSLSSSSRHQATPYNHYQTYPGEQDLPERFAYSPVPLVVSNQQSIRSVSQFRPQPGKGMIYPTSTPRTTSQQNHTPRLDHDYLTPPGVVIPTTTQRLDQGDRYGPYDDDDREKGSYDGQGAHQDIGSNGREFHEDGMIWAASDGLESQAREYELDRYGASYDQWQDLWDTSRPAPR